MPRASAGLVLLREGAGGLSVLLGRRSAKARFMPSTYVVPGGGLSGADRTASGFPEPLSAPPGPLDARTRRDLLPLARAALRELFEETGALLGEAMSGAAAPDWMSPDPAEGTAGSQAAHWAAYRRLGLQPAFARMTLVARAITPVDSPIRFHTRFFAADAQGLQWAGHGDGELEDIGWCDVEEAQSRPLPLVTQLVIGEALRQWHAKREAPAPLYCWRGERMFRRAEAAAAA